ncbi:MAG TPA: MXAN_5187 C-terminal domain-containing protein [Thermoanaerobaculia bacterium]|nr:MXAN_5187 C-terminal domain-containing protein [Thermoanaerobaculia bacterium]
MPIKVEDDPLEKLEEDIRRLKNRYDQFFSGIQKAPPLQERRNIDVFIHELSKEKIRDNSRRFRMNQLLSRYNQMREMWGRRMREREEGPLEFKRRQAAMAAEPEVAAARRPEPEPPRVTSAKSDPYVRVTTKSNGEEVRKLYEQIEREHFKLGKLPPVTFDQLTQMVQKQSEIVRSKYQVNTVAFRVETIDGKVKLKAKPLQE